MLEIFLERHSGTPLAQQIAEAIRSAIARGEFDAGGRLPAERALASRLGVDRMTVSRAYDDLASGGLVIRQVGRGSFVAAGLSRAPARGEAASPGLPWEEIYSTRARALATGASSVLSTPGAEGAVNFSSHFPDPSLFPVRGFLRALEAALRREGASLLGYGSAAGYSPLRCYLASSNRRRGMRLEEEEILITNGSQQAIDLVARVFLEPGDRVVMENPTYTGAVQLFQLHGARLAGVPVDNEGIRPDRLEEILRVGRAKLLYLIPNFQNPTSGTMSLARRRRLLEIASRHRVPILEDDFGGDLRYEGEAIPSLKALDRSDGVIYTSSFAKKLLPGLRIGWMAAPREVAEKLVCVKQITDWSTSQLLQGGLHEFCRRGEMERHLRRVLAVYRERRDAMVAVMQRYFPGEARWSRPEGGLVAWVTLPPGVDADEVALEARSRGVLVGRGDLFYVDGGTHNNLRLVFAQAKPAEIRSGIRSLGTILTRKAREAKAAASAGAPEPLPII
jgi:DNA-binding transcriptional MocR family regulator